MSNKTLAVAIFVIVAGSVTFWTIAERGPVLTPKPTPAPELSGPTPLQLAEIKIAYYNHVTEVANAATASRWDCLSEDMDTMLNNPTRKTNHRGPVCRDTCKKFAALRELDLNPPPGVPMAGEKVTELPEFCPKAKP